MLSSAQILLLTFLVSSFFQAWAATTMLGTPHVVSGLVFDDWDKDGIRDPLEPGIPSVVVSLWYLPAGQYDVTADSSKYVQVATYNTRFGSDTTSGQFQFSCLAAGSYKVAVHLATTRPGKVSPVPTSADEASDNDIISVSNGIGWTAAFEAEEAGSTEIGIGLIQTIFAVAFSLTGDQTVPPTVSTTTGALYAVLNASDVNPEMYFRLVRGEWSEGQIEEPGGFYQGWRDEAPGYQVRVLADVSNEKENVWFIPKSEFVDDLINGRMLVQLVATGSFSDKSRLRGQFSRFRRSTYIQTMIHLEGSSVVPLVSTSSHGTATFFLDISRKQLRYEISYAIPNSEMETSATLNVGSVGQNGPVLYHLPLGTSKSGVINGLDETFMVNLVQAQIYVSIATDAHPEGLLRGQIRAWQQVQYQSLMNLKTNSSEAGVLHTKGVSVFQLDLERQTVSYYVTYGGLSADEFTANITNTANLQWFDLEGDRLPAYQDGVKQGFYYLTADQINQFLQGQYRISIKVKKPNGEVEEELYGVITNWS